MNAILNIILWSCVVVSLGGAAYLLIDAALSRRRRPTIADLGPAKNEPWLNSALRKRP
jgi:hypothetical protein